MVVLRCSKDCSVIAQLEKLPNYKLKSKNLLADATELVAEVELAGKHMEMLEDLRSAEGVQEISILASVSGSIL
jgi:hypothetical protein